MPIADGWHGVFRWWLTRIPGEAHPWATVSGWDENGCLFDQAQVPAATAATVCAWIDAVINTRRNRRK